MQVKFSLKPISTGAVSAVPYNAALYEALSFTGNFANDDGTDDIVRMAHVDGGLMYVPRGLFPIGGEDYRTDGPFKFSHIPKVPPRDEEQERVISVSTGLLLEEKDHLLKASTGLGKTYMGCAIACRIGKPTLIVCTKNDLVTSWRKTLIELLGVPPSKIGHIQQGECDYHGKWFVTSMIHSLCIEDKYPPEMFRYFGLVLYDEVQNLGAESFGKAARLFYARHRLGLSATTSRKDGKQKLFEAHIGPVMVTSSLVPMKPRILMKKTGWKIPKVPKRNPVTGLWEQKEVYFAPGKMGLLLNYMVADLSRNALIAEFTVEALKAGRAHVVLMSDRKAHLELLSKSLLYKGVNPLELGYYVGGKTPAELEVAAGKKVVLATYQMCKEGTNFPAWDTLVPCTPKSDTEQIVGRILRTHPGKKTPVCLHLVDDSQIFKNYANSCMTYYYKIGAEVVHL